MSRDLNREADELLKPRTDTLFTDDILIDGRKVSVQTVAWLREYVHQHVVGVVAQALDRYPPPTVFEPAQFDPGTPTLLSSSHDSEVEGLRTIVGALEPFDQRTRQRMCEYIGERVSDPAAWR